jgi:RNA recognition motif-containing protein
MSAGDQDLYGTMIKVENKDIFVDLRQNSSGVYLKLSERNGTSRNTVLIPASGISRLKAVLDDVQAISLKNTRISHERKNRVAHDPAVVNRSIYVSGLAWSTTDSDLKTYFSKVAPVNSAVVLRKTRGGKSFSLGCGVVEYATPDLAAMAVSQMNDTELDGRMIKCREDRTVDDTSSPSSYGNNGGAGFRGANGPRQQQY